MPRALGFGCVLTVGVAVLAACGQEKPRLPKDTLPAQLALDKVPLGLDPQRPIPKDNPLTETGVRLGRRLFFDPILSANETVSCATCHDPAYGFASPDP